MWKVKALIWGPCYENACPHPPRHRFGRLALRFRYSAACPCTRVCFSDSRARRGCRPQIPLGMFGLSVLACPYPVRWAASQGFRFSAPRSRRFPGTGRHGAGLCRVAAQEISGMGKQPHARCGEDRRTASGNLPREGVAEPCAVSAFAVCAIPCVPRQSRDSGIRWARRTCDASM